MTKEHLAIVSCGHGTFEIIPNKKNPILPCGCAYDEVSQPDNPKSRPNWSSGLHADVFDTEFLEKPMKEWEK